MVDSSCKTFLVLFVLMCSTISSFSQINGSHFNLKSDSNGLYIENKTNKESCVLMINGIKSELLFTNHKSYLDLSPDHKGELFFINSEDSNMKMVHVSKTRNNKFRIQSIPLWLSIIPPLIAIILALVFKEVIISLFMGIWAGAFIIGGMRIASPFYFIMSFFDVLQTYIIEALISRGHISVIVFSLLIGGMVAIISKNGGMAGVVLSLSKYAKDAKSTQFITWLLGIAIFFDDYANTLIVGNTMRSVTDKFKISREKLAYIVDSTAAPVSAIAFITTWIGAELGYIEDGMSRIALESDATAYSIFLSSLKYSYYPILTLAFVLIIILTQRDFGPMLKAEKRSRHEGKLTNQESKGDKALHLENLDPVPGSPLKWQYAFFPVLTVILVTIYGLLDTGFDSIYAQISPEGNLGYNFSSIWSSMDSMFAESPSFFTKIGKIIGAADSYIALLWASLSGIIVAIAMTVYARIMKLMDLMTHMVTGFKTMLPALIILTLAWALAITTKQLHTAEFLSHALTGSVSPYFMSVLIFILAGAIAFSTGSSWSTMAILYPIAIPTTYSVCIAAGIAPDMTMEILLNVIATVLAASVLGDHCSPISDTTILSSLASDCNHIDHVKTQLPYALLVGAVSLLCVFLSTYLGGTGFTNFALYIVSILFLYFTVRKLGQKTTM